MDDEAQHHFLLVEGCHAAVCCLQLTALLRYIPCLDPFKLRDEFSQSFQATIELLIEGMNCSEVANAVLVLVCPTELLAAGRSMSNKSKQSQW